MYPLQTLSIVQPTVVSHKCLLCYLQNDRKTYQFAVVVLAVSAVLDVVCVGSLFLAQQPSELSTAEQIKNTTEVKGKSELSRWTAYFSLNHIATTEIPRIDVARG